MALCARPQLAALPLAAGSFFAGMGAHKAWSQLNYLLEPGLERIGRGLPAAWRGSEAPFVAALGADAGHCAEAAGAARDGRVSLTTPAVMRAEVADGRAHHAHAATYA